MSSSMKGESKMKIYVRTLVATSTDERTMMLEELDASPVVDLDGVAIANTSKNYRKGFRAYDIATGLYIDSARTKKELLVQLKEKELKIKEARKTELYQRRIKEFEEMKKL